MTVNADKKKLLNDLLKSKIHNKIKYDACTSYINEKGDLIKTKPNYTKNPIGESISEKRKKEKDILKQIASESDNIRSDVYESIIETIDAPGKYKPLKYRDESEYFISLKRRKTKKSIKPKICRCK